VSIHQSPVGPATTVAWPRDHHGSSALHVRAIGLPGSCSQGPSIERDLETVTMCPVGGPAVPPTALMR
jgi:hypothetical protein